jgi:hypothetical protein
MPVETSPLGLVAELSNSPRKSSRSPTHQPGESVKHIDRIPAVLVISSASKTLGMTASATGWTDN